MARPIALMMRVTLSVSITRESTYGTDERTAAYGDRYWILLLPDLQTFSENPTEATGSSL